MQNNKTNDVASVADSIQEGDKAHQTISAALAAGQAPMLDDLKSVWGGKEANRVIRDLATQGVAGVHRRRLRRVDGVRYKFGSGVVEQKGPGRFLLMLDDGGEAYLTAKSSKSVLAGDRVKAFLAQEDGSDIEALPAALLDRDPSRRHVARAKAREDGLVGFILDNRVDGVALDLAIDGVQPGDLWFCRVVERGLLRDVVSAKGVVRIGNETDKGIESELAFATRFPEEARCDESAWLSKLSLTDAKDDSPRRDVRDIPLATVDGETTSDFDDAIAAKAKPGGGWEIWVAIADVSAFVTPGSALDEFALKKMTSVYLPHQVHPMLPRSLSNGVCSLNPGEDRLALCCKMEVSAAGQVEGYEFFRGTMRSHARLTYSSLQDHLDGKLKLGSLAVEKSAADLSAAAAAMRAAGAREKRLDMGEDEVGFVYDDSGKIQSLYSNPRLWTHKIVEECMLAANRSAAEWIEGKLSTGVFRNHAGLRANGITDLCEALDGMGVKAGAGLANITQGKIAEILEEAKSLGKYSQARSAILSGMSSANYETDNTGHFSLVAPHYCHFTSPIRRYADLMVHRLIKATLDAAPSPYSREESAELSAKASKLSQLASQAENESRKLLILAYAKNFEGASMDARVSTIGERGVWVALPFPGASLEFFVAGKAMKNAGLLWSDDEQSWLGGKAPLIEGDVLRCKIEACDYSSRRVELAPEPTLRAQAKPSGGKR